MEQRRHGRRDVDGHDPAAARRNRDRERAWSRTEIHERAVATEPMALQDLEVLVGIEARLALIPRDVRRVEMLLTLYARSSSHHGVLISRVCPR